MKNLRFISIALVGALLVFSACKNDKGKEPIPTPTDKVTDVCGNTYPVAKIGTQYWMAENLKCNKYDSKSEAYNASWLVNNTIPTLDGKAYTPYYTDASDKSKWQDSSKEKSGKKLTDEQVAKLGYLYNWAATVGVADGWEKTIAFKGIRQGICPNGWHVPSNDDWRKLDDYICSKQNISSKEVGSYLKTTSGWYINGNGNDNYGFAALPAGDSYGCEVGNVGLRISLWSATPNDGREFDCAYAAILHFLYDDMWLSDHDKRYGQGVRCLRD